MRGTYENLLKENKIFISKPINISQKIRDIIRLRQKICVSVCIPSTTHCCSAAPFHFVMIQIVLGFFVLFF